MKVIILSLFISITSIKISAQSGGYAQGMLPIGVNNLWVYETSPVYHTHSIWIFGNETVTIDSYQYNILRANYVGWPQYVRLREDGYYVLRRDSTYNEPNHEEIYYKKDAQLGNNWTQHLITNDTLYYTSVVTDTFRLNIFDTVVTGKVVHKDLGLDIIDELWTEEFGLISTADFWGVMDYITGCVINGRVYGDTTTTPVEYEPTTTLPERIELFQNYPNPFNPKTNIEYILPKESYVNLTVYNSLGEEVTVLVDEFQRSGKYKVHFSTGEVKNLPSGVYFYSLKTEKSIITEKMMLLR